MFRGPFLVTLQLLKGKGWVRTYSTRFRSAQEHHSHIPIKKIKSLFIVYFSIIMTSTEGQDVVLCRLCLNHVEHHCNLCHVDLCTPCIQKHLADKTKRHEIVQFINKKEGLIFPECKSHKQKLCEMFCNDCNEPACALCITTTHKKHDITDIGKIIKNIKQKISNDLTELEKTISPKYRNVTTDVSSADFDQVLSDIQHHEDKICKIVRDIGSHMRDEVYKQKQQSEQKNKEIQFLAAETEKELHRIMQNSKWVLKSYDAAAIMKYKSVNDKFRDRINKSGISCPSFLPGLIEQDQIRDIFGGLQMQKSIVSNKKPALKRRKTPVVSNTIQSPYGRKSSELWRIACEGAIKIWTSGDLNRISQIDRNGSVLKTIETEDTVIALSLDLHKDLVFILSVPDTKVFKFESNKVVTLLNLTNWCASGLCHTGNGNLLVSMRSRDRTQSKVVRYSGITQIREIQNDPQGNLLFSVGTTAVLHLIENGNGDVCVADCAGLSVVGVDLSGELRFQYMGNVTTFSKYTKFKPSKIINDSQQHILINDDSNDIVHIIDSDGNFIRYIKYPCNGGISVDIDHNLVVGERKTGKIRIIKYLE